MSSNPIETCTFFVDDSNIWIEAQKFAASPNSRMPKLTDGDRDPRFRINIGKLVDTLRKNRSQGPSFLYGSRPPPNDSVWNAFKGFKFQTKIYDRVLGKEKQVDNSMATDMSAEATELKIRAEYESKTIQQKANTTFIVITGDRDMLPSVKKVLACDIKVELWAWNSGISKEYFKLGSQNKLLSVDFLDRIFDDIYFTAFRSTRKCTQVHGGQAIVLCEFTDSGEFAGPGQSNLESSVWGQLSHLGSLFYTTRSQTGTELFVEFPREKDMNDVILKARGLLSDMTVLSWPEYRARFNKDPPASVETSNMYESLTVSTGQYSPPATAEKECEPTKNKAKPPSTSEPEGGHGENEELQLLNNSEDSGGWQTVARGDHGKQHRRAMRKNQRCPDRLHCEKAGECSYDHTNKERDLFRDNPNQDFRKMKHGALVAESRVTLLKSVRI
ncbi:hypothetical protein G7Z17_g8668 [Cylindrodendrum hubeiense]|uniref:NYN domain-containing protein n=1 Tax=Cylindrodendrum hubeiense TaxID=595255 RepID=A0A9P5L6B1_9HYPO|nr:hypothetical protein G7Z17_g8668 [Cylindrodendrum hubeiense]